MTVISAQGLRKSYGVHEVLAGVTLSIEAGEHVALVGSNGSGKSTLGRVLAGLDTIEDGVLMRQRGARVGYLEQSPVLPAELTAVDAALAGLADWSRACARFEAIAQRLGQATGGEQAALLAEQSQVSAEIERLGGWNLRHRAEAMLHELGIADVSARVQWLSGGEKRRVALAQLLLAAPDLLVLDEPTNHLDVQSIDWLEKHLQSDFPGALLLITHDRYFLDRVATRTLELSQGEVRSYDGGWEEYLTAKAEREAMEARAESNRQNFLRTELDWLRRQPKARGTKQKARIERANAALQADRPKSAGGVLLEVGSLRQGSTIVELERVGITYGDRVLFRGLDLILRPGERLGILGPSGCGKTSLLRLIVGEQQPTQGTLRLGKNTTITYFAQSRVELDETETVAWNVAGPYQTVRFGSQEVSIFSYLQRFLFRGEEIRKKVGVLSGGERARVALAKLLLKPANLLILDEPTNDLDVETMSSLESMLCEFPGSALVVSHDRYFLDRVVTGLLVFESDAADSQPRVVLYPGGYTTYVRLKQEQALALAAAERQEAATKPAAPVVPERARKAGKLSYKEQRELEGMEAAIEQADAEVATAQAELQRGLEQRLGPDQATALALRVEQAQARVAALMDRWQELETKQNQVS